mmetsp:Transcript_28807/g.81268  ORF Transcript_28807/g.81268 Transcript_28807/m.81268 type:complete len:114 (+) Transcript_28807:114-455(+)
MHPQNEHRNRNRNRNHNELSFLQRRYQPENKRNRTQTKPNQTKQASLSQSLLIASFLAVVAATTTRSQANQCECKEWQVTVPENFNINHGHLQLNSVGPLLSFVSPSPTSTPS